MIRTPRQDLEQELQDREYTKLYGAAQAKAEFALTLAKSRNRSAMTQNELADRLGLSQPYIAKLEGGDANPTLGTIGSLLAVLGLRLVMDTEPLLSYPMVLALEPTSDMGVPGIISTAEDIAGKAWRTSWHEMLFTCNASSMIEPVATSSRKKVEQTVAC